eukprot:TRINITY_DN1866_c0_g1_i11.p2 TRINITY_DN1866_c0_g1~~TRINITY_DN1866_c0_g1_i11.p2  ORF type:complete len:200 (+),score=-15.62 TRINITY_DN1866_c0_g1_i11:195-794(+)
MKFINQILYLCITIKMSFLKSHYNPTNPIIFIYKIQKYKSDEVHLVSIPLTPKQPFYNIQITKYAIQQMLFEQIHDQFSNRPQTSTSQFPQQNITRPPLKNKKRKENNTIYDKQTRANNVQQIQYYIYYDPISPLQLQLNYYTIYNTNCENIYQGNGNCKIKKQFFTMLSDQFSKKNSLHFRIFCLMGQNYFLRIFTVY